MGSTKYKLLFTKVALEDLDEIYHYISVESGTLQIADQFKSKIEARLTQLKLFPMLGVVSSYKGKQTKIIRKLIIGNYKAFYSVGDKLQTVIILTIISSRRNEE